MLLLILLLALSHLTQATPSINLLINAQVPPVAQVNQSWFFVFAPSTFSYRGLVNYTLSKSVDWLQLEGSNRTFYGIPRPQDEGPLEVTLVATDDTGSVSMPVTFIVSANQSPGLGNPLAAQLPAYGAFSYPDSLLLTPGTALSLAFSPNTFIHTNRTTSYYAKSSDNTPLPSWVVFNPRNLSFSGRVPQATSPTELPLTVGIQLTASNVIGFSQAIAPFQLIVQSHLFAFGNTLQVMNVTPGSTVDHGLLGDISLDYQPASDSDVSQASTNAPPWLSLDHSSLVLSGRSPANVSEQNFTVSATDRYGDSASTIVLLRISTNSSLDILMPFPTLTATIGKKFTYDLNDSLSCNPNGDGVKFTIDPGAAGGWLRYDSSAMALQGTVPASLKPQSVQVTVTAIQGNVSQSEILDLALGCSNGTTCESSSSNGAGSTAVTGSGASSLAIRMKKGWIAAAVVLPVFAVIAALLLVTCCCRKNCRLRIKFDEERRRSKVKRAKKEEDKRRMRDDLKKKKISGPQQDYALEEAVIRPEMIETFHDDEVKAADIPLSHEQADPPAAIGGGHAAFEMRSANYKRSSIRSSMARFSRFRLSKRISGNSDRDIRPDSWQRYVLGLEPPGSKAAATPEFSLILEEPSPQKSMKSQSSMRPSMTMVSGPAIGTQVTPTRKLSKQRHRASVIISGPKQSGLGHGRSAPSQGSSSIVFGSRGVGHGEASHFGGPPGYGIVQKSWRNLSVISWTTTQSPPDSSDSVIWERPERDPTHKSSASVTSTFLDHPNLHSLDKSPRPQTIREALFGEGIEVSSRRMRSLPRNHVPSKREPPPPFIGGTNNEPLQVFHKRRRQNGSFHNPFLSAGPCSSRISSLQNPGSHRPGANSDNDLPITPRNRMSRRTYSRSSSLGSEFKASPSKTLNSQSSPPRKRVARNHNFASSALSRLHFNRASRAFSKSSFSSNSTDSRFESAPSEFGYNEALHEEVDEEGNKVWKYAEHPNPLRLNSTDVTDEELIESLKVDGQYSAAQRLSLLRAKAEGINSDNLERDGSLEVSSPLGRRMRRNLGLKQGGPSNTSLRGIIRDAGDSAFV